MQPIRIETPLTFVVFIYHADTGAHVKRVPSSKFKSTDLSAEVEVLNATLNAIGLEARVMGVDQTADFDALSKTMIGSWNDEAGARQYFDEQIAEGYSSSDALDMTQYRFTQKVRLG